MGDEGSDEEHRRPLPARLLVGTPAPVEPEELVVRRVAAVCGRDHVVQHGPVLDSQDCRLMPLTEEVHCAGLEPVGGRAADMIGGPVEVFIEPELGQVIADMSHLVDIGGRLALGIGLKRQLTYLAKKELFDIPLLGAVIRGCGAYPLDRDAGGVAAVVAAYATILPELELTAMMFFIVKFPAGVSAVKTSSSTCAPFR